MMRLSPVLWMITPRGGIGVINHLRLSEKGLKVNRPLRGREELKMGLDSFFQLIIDG